MDQLVVGETGPGAEGKDVVKRGFDHWSEGLRASKVGQRSFQDSVRSVRNERTADSEDNTRGTGSWTATS
jgi:hypothetical protein